MMPQHVFRPVHQLYQGICILNWQFKKKYQNESAKEIFEEKCPELFPKFIKICKNFSGIHNDVDNPLISYSGTLHYLPGTASFSCLRLGEAERTSFFIIFDFVPLLESEIATDIVLTPREREIVQIMAMGKTNKEISKMLCIGLETVKSHIRNLFAKTGTSSRVELIGKLQYSRCDGRASWVDKAGG
ncbi:response regulator transcription factor [Sporomusa aerivorans]|uniref:helix-turn-helix transcriptional regulator n=1 Tax=Sporomusa aerivorans TaxID=204936 RepID=UPI00352A2D8E